MLLPDKLVSGTTTSHALYLAGAMAAVVLGALGFEFIGGYLPCKLCLEQRTPYYLGAPLMLLAAMSSKQNWPSCLTRGSIAIGGLLMGFGLTIAVFHTGVEWEWWAGPTDCVAAAFTVTTNANDLMGDINALKPPSCDKAAIRILGVSMAGWNVPVSLALMVGSFRLATK